MSDTHRENAILQAIEILADKKISQASFDKTIKAVVKENQDQTTGKYLIKYQDSEFTAYATNSDIHYQQGQEVYILIPGNDFMGVKRILGSSNNKAIEYQELPVSKNLYNRLGTNVISLSENIELSSYKVQDRVVVQGFKIDTKAIKNYINSGDSLAIGMNIKTNFAASQTGGFYGLIFNLNFKDTNSREEGAVTTKSYLVGSKDVIGNPYGLTNWERVETLIYPEDIDIFNLIGVQSIEAFCEGFPSDETKEDIKDIIISDIYLFGANALTDSELNGYVLNIDYSEYGNIIDDEIPFVKLKAQLKIKGKITNQKIQYYWFRENGTIFRGDSKYFGKAGDGWECLNPYQNKNPIPYLSNDFSIYGTSENLPQAAAASLQKVTKIRCVAIYENNSFIGDCKVINQNLQDVVIQSNQQINGQNKTIYYLDNGSPTLTCKVYQPLSKQEYIPEEGKSLLYKWSVISYKGKGENIQSTPIDQEQMAAARKILQDAENMSQESRLRYIETQEYKEALAFVQTDNNARVENNIYYHFPIASINQSTKICCAVYEGNKYLGTGSITLENKAVPEGLYTLALEHGTQVFQYDKKGNSPTSNQVEKPLQIKPLNFTLLDNEGKEISHTQIINNGQIKWIYPNTQTLITTNYKENQIINGQIDFTVRGAEDLPLDWKYYNVIKNEDIFNYGIENQYDAKKNINYIWLNVKYKDMIFNAYTDFTFPKDGDPGTNGTDFVTKIAIPHGAERIYVNNSLGENKPSIQAYDDTGNNVGQLSFELYNNSIINQYNPQNLIWQCPLKIGESNSNHSYCICSSGVIKRQDSKLPKLEGTIEDILSIFKNDKPLNIVRAKYTQGDVNYYAECPINYSFVINKNYRLRIAPRTGYKYVVYAEDGTSPSYDNTVPFKIILEKQIQKENNLYWIKEQVGLSFEWDVIGNLDIITDPSDSDKIRKLIIPKDTFDGSNLTNAIICLVKQTIVENGQEIIRDIGFIHIPIYMILNRYGHQALNDWDGNSIELNDKGNYILAPQIGAGVKDSTNGFTGVFMGTIEGLEEGESDRDRDRGIESDDYKIGFAGYHQGARTIFLDSKTGKAQFGKNNAGRITLDPTQKINGEDSALIYSGNYPIADFIEKQDVENVGNQMFDQEGNESEIGDRRTQGGMIIDLSTPQIGFGSGNFTVNKYGHIVAKGGGQIAGWKITDNRLYKENTGMSSSGYGIHQIDATLPKADSTVAFYAGTNNAKNNFYVTHDGFLFSKSGQIAGWDITPYQLNKGTTVGMNSINTPNETGSITISVPTSEDGKTKESQTKAFFANGDNFYVTHQGFLKSNAGRIGNWHISTSGLSNIDESGNKLSLSPTSGIQLLNGSDATKKFKVNANGYLESTSGKIGGWNISTNALSANGITISSSGSIKASNWGIYNDDNGSRIEIDQGRLGDVTIDSKGIKGSNWYIYNNSAKIPGLQVQAGGTIVYNVSGGITGSGGSSSGSGYDSNGNSFCHPKSTYTAPGGTETLQAAIKKMVVQALYAGNLKIPTTLSVNSDGSYKMSNTFALIFDGTRSIINTKLWLNDQLRYNTISQPEIGGSSYKGQTKVVNFNNDTKLVFRCGWCVGGKDVKGNTFGTVS